MDSCVTMEKNMQPNQVKPEIRREKIYPPTCSIAVTCLEEVQKYFRFVLRDKGGRTVQLQRFYLCRAAYGLLGINAEMGRASIRILV